MPVQPKKKKEKKEGSWGLGDRMCKALSFNLSTQRKRQKKKRKLGLGILAQW
jgi:hypothetical protein